jgi:hypothetical protein
MITMKYFTQYLAPSRPTGPTRPTSLTCLTILLVSLALISCTKKTPSTILAKIGNRQITVEDFEREVQWHLTNHRPLPDKQVLLDQMISHELRLQKARSLGLDNDPDVRRRYESMLVARLEEHELFPQLNAITVPPEAVKDAFQKELVRYTRPAKVRLALVLIKTDPKMSPERLAEQETRINEARKLALALPPDTHGFGSVAANFSDDQASRYKGGDVGWFDAPLSSSSSASSSSSNSGGQLHAQTLDAPHPYYRWPTEVVVAGLALTNKGAISEVIKTEKGFFFVSQLDSRPASVTPFEQAQPAIQRRLLAEKRDLTQESFAHQLQAFASVQVFTQALVRIQYPAATVARAQEEPPPMLQGANLSSNGKTPVN